MLVTPSLTRVGTDNRTFKQITGWDHCAQCLQTLMSTRVGTRVMRLSYGSDVPPLLDSPGNAATIALCYSAMAKAIDEWEPGFELRRMELISAGSDGAFEFELDGIFYPLGHLGDRSLAEERQLVVRI